MRRGALDRACAAIARSTRLENSAPRGPLLMPIGHHVHVPRHDELVPWPVTEPYGDPAKARRAAARIQALAHAPNTKRNHMWQLQPFVPPRPKMMRSVSVTRAAVASRAATVLACVVFDLLLPDHDAGVHAFELERRFGVLENRVTNIEQDKADETRQRDEQAHGRALHCPPPPPRAPAPRRTRPDRRDDPHHSSTRSIQLPLSHSSASRARS